MPFDVKQLIPLIGGAGGAIGHNPIGGSAFLQGWQQAAQEHQAMLARQQEQARQQELLKIQQAQNERAGHADTRAQQEQYLQAVNSVRQLLGDQSIESPDQYAQREQFVMQLAPKLGVDTGFVQSLRPTPDVYSRRKLQKVYDQFSKLPETERLQFEQGGHWNIDGQMYTPAQARQALGIGGQTATGEPFAFSKPVTPEKPPTPGSFEDYLQATPERRKQIEAARQSYGEAGRTPQDEASRDLDRQIKEVRLEQLKQSSGLSPRQQQQVTNVAKSFDTNQVAKNTQTIAEGAQFAQSLDPNKATAADDQGLIYAFAKAMDPNSVVREGEYATVQRYAQAWAETLGFSAARIFSNTAFLTPQARQNMKRTIMAKFRAAQGQYKAVRDSYVKKINMITGQNDGENWLTDYASAFPQEGQQPTQTTAAPAGGVPNPFRK